MNYSIDPDTHYLCTEHALIRELNRNGIKALVYVDNNECKVTFVMQEYDLEAQDFIKNHLIPYTVQALFIITPDILIEESKREDATFDPLSHIRCECGGGSVNAGHSSWCPKFAN